MSLAEYRTSTSVDVSLVDPFATRLLRLLEHFGGRVLVMSGRRDAAEGKRLYDLWIAGEGNYAAFPGTSLHEKGQAADLRIVDPKLSWRTVHAEGDIRGVKFPLANHPDPNKRENWHAEADHAWIEPPPEEDDMGKVEWRILAPAGSAAKFIAPMAPLPDGTLAALYATWLPTGHHVDQFAARGVVEQPCGVEDLRNVTLLGPLPTGDAREWTAADWLAVA